MSAPRSSTDRTRRAVAIQVIASSTPQRWLASTAMRTSGPTASRATRKSANVGFDVGAHLQFQHREAVGDGLACQASNLVVVVSEPTG